MKLAVPDMISNSYFPAIAAIELGCFKQEGLDVSLELIYPVDKSYAALREGTVDFVGGSAHSALCGVSAMAGRQAPVRAGARHVLVPGHAQGPRRQARRPQRGQGTQHRRGAVGRDGAAPPADRSRHRPGRDRVKIAPVPGAQGAGVNFGVTAAKALEERKIDGFWANGMGTEVAVRRGVGTVVLDVRRGDGPKPCFNYTMASIAASRPPDRALARDRGRRRARHGEDACRLEGRMSRARPRSARKLFPPSEAELIAELIRRDLPYYDASISKSFVAGMNQFSPRRRHPQGRRAVRERRRDAVFAFVEGRVAGRRRRWQTRCTPLPLVGG